MVELQGGTFTASIPSKTLFLPINKQEIMAKGVVSKEKYSRIVDTVYIKMKESATALYKSDLMILDFLMYSSRLTFPFLNYIFVKNQKIFQMNFRANSLFFPTNNLFLFQNYWSLDCKN